MDALLFIIIVVAVIFAGDGLHRWWRANRWRYRWRSDDDDDDDRGVPTG
jgi:hypothetical protein